MNIQNVFAVMIICLSVIVGIILALLLKHNKISHKSLNLIVCISYIVLLALGISMIFMKDNIETLRYISLICWLVLFFLSLCQFWYYYIVNYINFLIKLKILI